MNTLNEGDAAPAFSATDQNGNPVSLADFLGKRVILYFYPKDDTPGCTAQACNLRDHYGSLTRKGYVVLGVSVDSEKSHKKFEEKYQLPFTLIADPERKIVNAYGVFGAKKFMGKTFQGTLRTTFLINEKGIIDRILRKPETHRQTEQILETWG